MPSRYVKTVADHAKNDRARAAARDTSSLDRRIDKLLDKLSPDKYPELLEADAKAPILSRWEIEFGQLALMIMLDELSNHMLDELPEVDRQVRQEMTIAGDIGDAALDSLHPINLKEVDKLIRRMEGKEDAS